MLTVRTYIVATTSYVVEVEEEVRIAMIKSSSVQKREHAPSLSRIPGAKDPLTVLVYRGQSGLCGRRQISGTPIAV